MGQASTISSSPGATALVPNMCASQTNITFPASQLGLLTGCQHSNIKVKVSHLGHPDGGGNAAAARVHNGEAGLRVDLVHLNGAGGRVESAQEPNAHWPPSCSPFCAREAASRPGHISRCVVAGS